MLAATAVILAGAGLTALGIVQSTLYSIGVVVIFIGLVGAVVRLVDMFVRP